MSRKKPPELTRSARQLLGAVRTLCKRYKRPATLRGACRLAKVLPKRGALEALVLERRGYVKFVLPRGEQMEVPDAEGP